MAECEHEFPSPEYDREGRMTLPRCVACGARPGIEWFREERYRSGVKISRRVQELRHWETTLAVGFYIHPVSLMPVFLLPEEMEELRELVRERKEIINASD